MKVLSEILTAIKDFMDFFLVYMPGSLGIRLRYICYRKRFKSCGERVRIFSGVQISGFEYISIGNNVIIDNYCILNAGVFNKGNIRRISNKGYLGNEGELRIGNNIHIAPFSVIMAYGGVIMEDNCAVSSGGRIYSLTNTPTDPNNYGKKISIMPLDSPESPFQMAPIVLSGNVWIGFDSIVMPGTFIGKDSFVSSCSLVVGRFKENSYIAGQPAKRIGDRFKGNSNSRD